ncbi:efflux RND transporter periplasmic adaptor subunit [bacterium SCSIO 12741]|nr:efflux RND transporter periplasmic adaptor subunit [bacterium SCSIO 12741]
MKTLKSLYILVLSISVLSCQYQGHDHGHDHEEEHGHEHGTHSDVIFLTEQQFETMEMKVDTLPIRNLQSYVQANGRLEVPPQNEAAVTAIIGANIFSIQVIEGDPVKKGQVLAYLSHPDLIRMQTDYVGHWNQLNYLEKEYNRQKRLYDEKVGSGKDFQKTQADYQSKKGLVKGFEAQLRQMGLDIERLRQSDIYEQVPVISPIDGHIRLVEVKTGQYVQAHEEMFEIVNIEHIHADLMVFEKDMHLVKEGQKVKIKLESYEGLELDATIYSVGKAFEEDPKAIHLHADIENKQGHLIPGTYVSGRILVDDNPSLALPEEALVREGDKYYLFMAKYQKERWAFKAIEVKTGITDAGWTEVKLYKPLKPGTQIALNNAYYLLADWKKEEAEHSH